jgi:hypothetical protein
MWDFDNISESRRVELSRPFQFPALIEQIRSEAHNLRFEREKGAHEAKGSWRPIFRFDVGASTFDSFFNNQSGYRGQYLGDPEQGRNSNDMLMSELVATLVQSSHGDGESLGQVRASLLSPHAKIWIEEDQHTPRTPELIVQIRVPEWEAAAREVRNRLDQSDPTVTAKEVDRIFGVRAPEGRTLKALGAWVSPSGSLCVVPSKVRRAQDIQAYGVS